MASNLETKPTATTARKHVISLAAVIGLVALSGLVISSYVLLVHTIAEHGGSREAVQQAASLVAEDLLKVTVEDERFGRVGLSDTTDVGYEHNSVIGLNRLYATLLTASTVSEQLHLAYMGKLARSDWQRVRSIQKSLANALQNAVRAPEKGKTGGSLYERAHAIASRAKGLHGGQLIDFKIRLGTVKVGSLSSQVKAPGQAKDSPFFYNREGFFLALTPMPVPDNEPIIFYQMAARTQATSPSRFQPDPGDVVPTTVLIEATYKNPDPKLHFDSLTMETAAATVGAAPFTPEPSVCLFSFPQGIPPQFESIQKILSFDHWSSDGEWLEAASGPVPGWGRLIQVKTPPGKTNPGHAIQQTVYDWLVFAGALNPVKVVQMCQAPWAVPNPSSDKDRAELLAPNSALMKDTGARAYALLNQSQQGGAGQQMLKHAFDGVRASTVFPRSSLPLIIDQNGRCNIPGQKDFDESLAQDFLNALHDTNSAGVESLSVASAIVTRLKTAIVNLDESLSLSNEEIRSLNNRIERLATETSADAQKELALLKSKRAELALDGQVAINRKQNYLALSKRAETVKENAEHAALASYDICSDMWKYCQTGLERSSSRPGAYLLGRRFLFIPHTEPVSEEDIYSPPKNNAWLSDDFSALQDLGGNSKPQLPVSPAAPSFITADTRQMVRREYNFPTPLSLAKSPFDETGLPKSQRLFYALDCLQSGDKPKVGWSLIIRDMVANEPGKSNRLLKSRTAHWCLQEGTEMISCPGLACEIQIRSPRPLLPQLPFGSYVVNPLTKQRTSQIPAAPPGVM